METTRGLIIKQSDYGEGNRMLTIFTEKFGIIKAAIYGVKKAKSRQSAASQFLCWSEFVLFFGKGEVATVNSISAIENFFPIQEDLTRLALANYLTDITLYSQTPDLPNPSLLRILLNTLYACAYRGTDLKKAKAVYELRLAADMGYMPILGHCAACGKNAEPKFFSPEYGGVLCAECHSPLKMDISIDKETYLAIGYILTADEKKIFSFNAAADTVAKISTIAEGYILYKMEREFFSLNYLKNVLTEA